MKKQLHRIFMVILCLSGIWSVQAYDFKVDGIYYNESTIEIGAVEVTYDQFSGGSYSGNVVIPDTVIMNGDAFPVTAIGDNAFYNCPDLTSVTLPEGLLIIKMYAFDSCTGLTEITIPSTVTVLEECPFIGCPNITTVFCCPIIAPAWSKQDWDDSFANATIYIPEGSDFYYEASHPWETFNLDFFYTLQITPAVKGTGRIDMNKVTPYFKNGEEVIIKAIPNAGYSFNKWSDGNTENPRTLIMTQNLELAAEFINGSAIEGVDANGIKVYSTKGTLYIENATAGEQVAIYNLLGQTVKTAQIKEGSNRYSLAAGVYLVKCGSKIVKVQL